MIPLLVEQSPKAGKGKKEAHDSCGVIIDVVWQNYELGLKSSRNVTNTAI